MIDKMIKFLEKSDIPVIYRSDNPESTSKDDTSVLLVCDGLMINYDTISKKTQLSFHIAAPPDNAADIALRIQRLRFVKDVEVVEVHCENELNTETVFGEDAVKSWESHIRSQYLNEFHQNSKQLDVLLNHEAYQC